jgi:hypothetical protein
MPSSVGFSGAPSFEGLWVGIATTLTSFLMLAPFAAAWSLDVLPVFIGAAVAVGYIVATAAAG